MGFSAAVSRDRTPFLETPETEAKWFYLLFNMDFWNYACTGECGRTDYIWKVKLEWLPSVKFASVEFVHACIFFMGLCYVTLAYFRHTRTCCLFCGLKINLAIISMFEIEWTTLEMERQWCRNLGFRQFNEQEHTGCRGQWAGRHKNEWSVLLSGCLSAL